MAEAFSDKTESMTEGKAQSKELMLQTHSDAPKDADKQLPLFTAENELTKAGAAPVQTSADPETMPEHVKNARDIVDSLQTVLKEAAADKDDPEESEHTALKPGDLCPECGGVLVLRSTERGEFLGCSCYPDCSFVRHLPAAPVSNLVMLPSTCPDCGQPMAVKRGRYGLFIACSTYPSCRHIAEQKQDSPLKCPMCSKGRIVKRQSRSGRSFWACNNYPSCDFLMPGEPVESKCPECGFPLRYKKKVKAGIALYCPNTLCASRRKRKKDMWTEDMSAK